MAVGDSPADCLPVHGEVELRVAGRSICLVHAVGNILGLFDPGRDGLLKFVKAFKKGLELCFVVVPALKLLLIVGPAFISRVVGIIKPVEGRLHTRLHLLKARIALIELDLLRVKVVEQPVPDDLAHYAGHGDLSAVVADACLADAGGHVDKMAHYVLRAGGGRAFVRKPHGKAAEREDVCKLTESLCVSGSEL